MYGYKIMISKDDVTRDEYSGRQLNLFNKSVHQKHEQFDGMRVQINPRVVSGRTEL